MQSSLIAQIRLISDFVSMPDESKSKRAENVAEVLGKELKPRRRWTGKYILQIYSGHLTASKYIEIAVERYNNKMFNRMKKDRRHGSIRIDFEEGIDKHEARALILANLTPEERGTILLKATEKA